MKPVTIIGGGLAGLSLAHGLLQRGVEVTVLEAQTYPRNKVCGEFISGLKPEVVKALDLGPPLHNARRHNTVAWIREGKVMRRDRLPAPALGISRRYLDHALARRVESAGGALKVRTRITSTEAPRESVWATGRRASPSGWIGLKAHVEGMETEASLEFHLGDRAYVGLAGVESGELNLCGLFEKRPGLKGNGFDLILAYLRNAGLDPLADRVAGRFVPESFAAVAAVGFGGSAPEDRLAIGDAHAMIPPFTGDGMAMAFESAATALAPILDYAAGRNSWDATIVATRRIHRARFHRRLACARILHSLMIRPSGQRLLHGVSSLGLLPFRFFFQMLH